ncbi:MAG: protein-tyrosine-phosphatase [Flavobacteriaceae bacterium]|nr:protein-tyrosine-phosphatase [Bacteroidia bacterium]NNL15500.1 protein-tyrosine-phosphatase [Flavobacteriaceae bacterium]
MLHQLISTINNLDMSTISDKRKEVLEPLIEYIQQKVNDKVDINLNLICTHNSRRSHLSQVWSQTMASFYNIKNVRSYSGGTEATAMFPMVAKTLIKNGFQVKTLSEDNNPVYSIKFSDNEHPVIGFSKKFDDDFNPKSDFAAIMTCSHADENCPIVMGCDIRIPVTFEDPKNFDGTPQQEEKYLERSLQIATEMKYVFSKIKV